MKKQLKVRFWDKTRKRMLNTAKDVEILYKSDGSIIARNYDYKGNIQILELLEYTGLKDKNGKEIYEGDIVKAASQGRRAVCEVKWGVATARFFLHREHGGLVWNLSGGGKDYREETVEIIGNIYENPELLEKSAA